MRAERRAPVPPPDEFVLVLTYDEVMRVREAFGGLSKMSFNDDRRNAYGVTADIFHALGKAL